MTMDAVPKLMSVERCVVLTSHFDTVCGMGFHVHVLSFWFSNESLYPVAMCCIGHIVLCNMSRKINSAIPEYLQELCRKV